MKFKQTGCRFSTALHQNTNKFSLYFFKTENWTPIGNIDANGVTAQSAIS